MKVRTNSALFAMSTSLMRRLARMLLTLGFLGVAGHVHSALAAESTQDPSPRVAKAAADSKLLDPLASPVSLKSGQSATLLPDGRWLLLGGRDGKTAPSAARLFDPVTKRTTNLADGLITPRRDHSATLLPDGTVLILGGVDTAGAITSTSERYVPATGKFEAVADLGLLARSKHRATVLADGRVLITGGVDQRQVALYDAELLDAAKMEVERFNVKLETARFSHIATLLPSHTVLLWGGYGADGKPLANSEVFDPLQLRFLPYDAGATRNALASLAGSAPPQIVESDPAEGASDVPGGQPLVVRFSKLLDVSTLSAQTVTLIGPTGQVSATVTPVEGGLLVFVAPRIELLPASDYTLMIHGAKDAEGQALELSAIGFKTRSLGSEPGAKSGSGADTRAQDPAKTDGGKVSESPGTTAPGGSATPNASQPAGASAAAASPAAAGASPGAQPEATSDDDEDWVPSAPHYKGNWTSGRRFAHSRDSAREDQERMRLLESLSPRARRAIERRWQEKGIALPASQPNPLLRVTQLGIGSLGSVSGQVLRLNGRPLAGVTLTMAGQIARTDVRGEFALHNVPPGERVLVIDGRSANHGNKSYGRFEYRMAVKPGANDLDFTIWMPKLDTRNAVKIAAPTLTEVVVRNPKLPGFELRIPPGSVIRDAEGKIVTEVSITPIPMDQLPFPMPYADVPIFYTIQPGGATIESANGRPSPGARLVYPNYTNQLPGTKFPLFDYDPKGRGWYIYTHGSVSADGLSIVPERPFVIYQFTATSGASSGGIPPDEAPGCQDAECQCPAGGAAGDPVSCHDGLFLETHTDLALRDTISVALTRTYRPRDTTQRAFGVGANHIYGMFLSFVNQVGFQADGIELILASGGRIRFMALGNKAYGEPNAIYESANRGEFYKARIQCSSAEGSQFVLTMKDGRRMGFSYYGSKLKWMEDRLRNRITLVRDASQRIASLISPNGRYIEFEYGAASCTSCITKATDVAGRAVSYAYDASGRLTRVTNPEGGLTEYAYDASHRMVSVKDARGNTKVTNEYDANGRVAKQTYADGATNLFAYTLDAVGKAVRTEVTRERGDVRRILYDAAGNITAETYALGKPEQQTTSLEYTANNLLAKHTDALGRVSAYEYDAAGNRTKVTRLFGTAEAVSWRYTYEPVFNQVKTVTDPLERVTTYSYDANGNLTQIKDALNHLTDITYNAAGQPLTLKRYAGARTLTTTFDYDGADLVSVTDPLGRMTTIVTDSIGRPLSVKNPLGHLTRIDRDTLDRVTAVTDPQGNVVRYAYDGNGNLLSFTDAKNNVTTWSYDARNRARTKKDALLKTESYLYDAAGNLAFVTDRKGQVSGFEYDFLGRRTKASYGAASTASPVYQNSISYTWDSANRLTQLADSVSGTITRSYDNRFDSLDSETGPDGSISYSYYADGRRQRATPAGGTAITTTFDAAGRLIGLSQAAGTGSANPSVAQNVTLAYDEADRRTHLTLPNGTRISYAYDDASQLTAIDYKKGDGTPIGELTYAYDGAGRRIRMSGSLARTTLPAAVASASYDANNRLTNWGGTALDYDDNGNLIFEGTTSYTWNARNQLVATSQGGASFGYDAAGRRRSRSASGISLQTLYDGWNPIQLQQAGAAMESRLFGLGLDEIYGRTKSSTSQSYLTDALGSVLELANPDHSAQAAYTYSAYGQTTESPGAGWNLIKYTAREQDTASLYYYRNRYYSPLTSRFISEDPIGLEGGVNLYAYVGGNPISFVDPVGLDPWGGSTGSLIVASGGTFRLYGDGGNSIGGSYGYTSGVGGSTDPTARNVGPIPPGGYTLNPSEISEGGFLRNLLGDWGSYRAPLHPDPGTNTFGRDGFFLHGGRKPGSKGCIDVGHSDIDLFPQLRGIGGPIPVFVGRP